MPPLDGGTFYKGMMTDNLNRMGPADEVDEGSVFDHVSTRIPFAGSGRGRSLLDEVLADEAGAARARRRGRQALPGRRRGPRGGDLEPGEARRDFNPTFTSSRFEREWILTYLSGFYEARQIVDVLQPVKGGKEATVYCCAAHPATGLSLLAAKVYRPRIFRTLRNDARYRQGRKILDEQGKEVRDWRRLHAVAKGTSFGRDLQHTSWLEHEYQTLSVLYEAGVGVPRPVGHGSSAILMEYLGEAARPAPTLNRVALAPGEAPAIFERLLRDVELMLACRRVHGDLSAYNVLYWEGEVRIIDFPQAIDPYLNPDAYDIFGRDLRRLCQYFAKYGLRADAAHLAQEMWARQVRPPTARDNVEEAQDESLLG